LQAESDKRVMQARADFENAAVSDTVAPLVEPAPDIEPLTLLGNVQFVGADPGAFETYARAVDAFIEADAPVDQVLALANAVTHLAVLQIAGGACRAGASAGAPDARWQRRGFAPKDLCALAAANEAVTAPGLLQLVRPLVAPAIARCVALLPSSSVIAMGSGIRERFAVLDCLAVSGPNDPAVSQPFRTYLDGGGVNAAIERALGRAP